MEAIIFATFIEFGIHIFLWWMWLPTILTESKTLFELGHGTFSLPKVCVVRAYKIDQWIMASKRI